MFLGLNYFSSFTDPAEHLLMLGTGSAADDLDELDRDLSEVLRTGIPPWSPCESP